MNRACFPKEKHQNSQKWAKFMNFSFWPFFWFGLPGRLLLVCLRPSGKEFWGLEDPNLLKLRRLVSSCLSFLSAMLVFGDNELECSKCCRRKANIAFRTSKCGNRLGNKLRENSKCHYRLGKKATPLIKGVEVHPVN